MASFDADDDPNQQLDFQVLINGPVVMYWDRSILNGMRDWLVGAGYRVVILEVANWASEAAMHDSIAPALGFPDYYGRNLHALNDCLSDVATAEYGLSADDRGLALVLLGYDTFARQDPSLAHSVLDIFATQSRAALLFGNRMLCLVQSDDPRLTSPPVGATPVVWNPAEWLDSKRGV